MRNKARTAAIAVLIICAVLFVLILAFGEQFKKIFIKTEPEPVHTREIIYYAHGNLDPNDNIPQKDRENYFGFNAYRAGTEAVKAGKVASLEDFLVGNGNGDFFERMYHDPALCAAVALYLDNLGVTGSDPILKPEASLLPGERADAAHLRFLKNEQDWDDALARIRAILLGKDVKYQVKELSRYTSAMYMIPCKIDGDKPAIVVRNTSNAGGHFLVFYVKLADSSVIEVRFRLECGYQPIDVPRWPVPDTEDDPEPHTTTPTPKDRNDDPQNNPDAPKYDFYSPDKHNNDPDTTETDEPKSPETYVAPTQPVTIVTPTPEAETDHGQGDTETHGGQQYIVETGDQNLPPLEDIAEEGNPNKPTVEPGLEGLNTGTVTDFE